MTRPCPLRQVLKILLHTCSQGSPQFVLQLKRNASFIREAAGNGLGGHGRAATAPWEPQNGSCCGGCARNRVLPHLEQPHRPLCVSAVFSGPPDPLHGNSLNQKVRAAAQVGAGGTGQPSALSSGDSEVLSTPLSLSEPHRTWPAFCSQMHRCHSPWHCPPGPRPRLVSTAPQGGPSGGQGNSREGDPRVPVLPLTFPVPPRDGLQPQPLWLPAGIWLQQ